MKKLHAVVAITGAISLAACGTENPTGSTVVEGAVPRLETGVMYGSGNSPAKEAAADSQGATTADQAGGVMYGSGN